jgi:hypothetical protein
MRPFTPCPRCSRLVFRRDASCPFCGATCVHAVAPAQPVQARVSRAVFLAVGSVAPALAAGACSDKPVVPIPEDRFDASIAEADAVPALDAATVRDAGSCRPLPEKGTGCGSAACDVTTEYCSHTEVAERPCSDGCWTEGNYACRKRNEPTDPSTYYPTFPKECIDTPTCACVAPHLPKLAPGAAYNVSCLDLRGTVQLQFLDTASCGYCYGAPPARLDRLVYRVVS